MRQQLSVMHDVMQSSCLREQKLAITSRHNTSETHLNFEFGFILTDNLKPVTICHWIKSPLRGIVLQLCKFARIRSKAPLSEALVNLKRSDGLKILPIKVSNAMGSDQDRRTQTHVQIILSTNDL